MGRRARGDVRYLRVLQGTPGKGRGFQTQIRKQAGRLWGCAQCRLAASCSRVRPLADQHLGALRPVRCCDLRPPCLVTLASHLGQAMPIMLQRSLTLTGMSLSRWRVL